MCIPSLLYTLLTHGQKIQLWSCEATVPVPGSQASDRWQSDHHKHWKPSNLSGIFPTFSWSQSSITVNGRTVLADGPSPIISDYLWLETVENKPRFLGKSIALVTGLSYSGPLAVITCNGRQILTCQTSLALHCSSGRTTCFSQMVL